MIRHLLLGLLAAGLLFPPTVRAVDSGGLLLLRPSILDFGSVPPGATAIKDLVIINQGPFSMPLSSIGIEGNQAEHFRIMANGCPAVLFSGRSCQVAVVFHPPMVGQFSAQLAVRTPEFEEFTTLSGVGDNGSGLFFDPGFLDFGALTGTTSKDMTVPVGNAGRVPLRITRIIAPVSPFSILSDSCSGRLLRPEDNCQVTLRFAAGTPGTFSANLTAHYEDGAPRTASLSMSGTRIDGPSTRPGPSADPNAPDLRVSTEVLDFGPVTTGKEQLRFVTVRNLGAAPGSVGSLTIPSDPFAIAEDGCSGRQLAPSAICRIAVRAAPSVVGPVQSGIDLPTSSQGTLRVALRAQGVDIPLPAIMVRDRLEWEEDRALSYGERFVGRSIVTTVTVENIGSAPLSIPLEGVAQTLDPPFFFRTDGCSGQIIPPGGGCAIQVRFAPYTPGAWSDTFTLRSDDPRYPNLTLSASGAGFIAAGNNPPTAPVLIHPDPNQESLRDTIAFRWSRCADPDGDPVFYQLFLSNGNDFTAVESRLAAVPEGLRLSGFGAAALGFFATAHFARRKKGWVAVLLLVSVLLACSDEVEDNAVLEVGNLEPMTTYYWKVMSDDGRGGLAESEVRSFTTR